MNQTYRRIKQENKDTIKAQDAIVALSWVTVCVCVCVRVHTALVHVSECVCKCNEAQGQQVKQRTTKANIRPRNGKKHRQVAISVTIKWRAFYRSHRPCKYPVVQEN